MSSLIALSGKKGVGKSYLLEKLVNKSKNENLSPCGFFTRGQKKRCFVNVKTGDTWQFTRGDGEITPVGQYTIRSDAFEFAASSLSCYDCDFYIIDEIGKLELRKKGLFQYLQPFFSGNNKLIIACIRLEVLEEIEDLMDVKIKKTILLDKREQQNNIIDRLLRTIRRFNDNK